MEIGCIPHEALVSFLIFFFFFGPIHSYFWSQKSACLWGFLPYKTCALSEIQLLLQQLSHSTSLLISKFLPHCSFLGFQRKKKNYYFRASAHTIPPACSSPSLQLSKFIFPEKAFSSLYLNKRPPPIYFMTLNTVLHFVLFMFFFLYCQTSPSSSIKAVTWCDLFIIAPSSPV